MTGLSHMKSQMKLLMTHLSTEIELEVSHMKEEIGHHLFICLVSTQQHRMKDLDPQMLVINS
jgi:hypothetical protein